MFAALYEKYIRWEEVATSLDTRLENSKFLHEDFCEKRDQLRITHADLATKRDSAQRGATDLRIGVIYLEFKLINPTIPEAELSETICYRDRYQPL